MKMSGALSIQPLLLMASRLLSSCLPHPSFSNDWLALLFMAHSGYP